MNRQAQTWLVVWVLGAIVMTLTVVSAVKPAEDLLSASASGLPAIAYLGEGSGTYIIDANHMFVVKYKSNNYKLEPGPIYQATPRERVWDFSYVPDDAVMLFNSATSFGPVGAGDTILYALIDDDVDDRTSHFSIDDTVVHNVAPGMVVYGSFVAPHAGELLFSTEDGVGLIAYSLSLTRTPFPTVTPTLTPTPVSTPLPGTLDHVFTQSWGSDVGVFTDLLDMAIWKDRLFVLDRGKLSVEVFDFHGVPLYAFPLVLPISNPLSSTTSPVGFEVDAAGNVYVAIDGALEKYTPDGRLITMWEADILFGAQGLAVGDDGSVYVSLESNRIARYTSEFRFVTEWGMVGSGGGQINNPGEMAIDEDGNAYVVDRGNYRIQKFNREGAYLGQWGGHGTGNGQFKAPDRIAITPDGFIYVSDAELDRVQRFDLDGNYLSQWASPGPGEAPFAGITSVAAARGLVFVGDVGNDRIYKFTSGGDYLTGWGIKGSDIGQLNRPVGLAVADDTVYFADAGNDRVQLFTRDGSYLAAWGSMGSGEGQFDHPLAVEVGHGYVYVLDEGNSRVQKFSTDGEFILQWGSEGEGSGQFINPWDLAIDQAGFVYVVDNTTSTIQKFTADGDFVTKWTHEETGTKFGIAVDSQGYVYTVNLRAVQKFTPDGTLVAEWGTYGSGEGQFIGPQGIAIDAQNRLYIVDTFNRRVQVFSSTGEYLSEMGSYGSGDGQFLVPLRTAVGRDGDVFVSDNRLSRIVKYAAQRPPADPQSGLIANGSFEITSALAAWTYGHDFAEPAVAIANQASDGAKAVQLGRPVSQEPQDRSTAWLYQTVYVDPNWQRPLLSFDYRMFVNDTIDYSDFYVWVSSSQGGWKATLLRDGFRSCNSPATAPPAGFDLGWRSTGYDLSPFKGQTIRIRFENRNLHQDLSLGAWTYVDNVRVLDMAGTLVEPSLVYLPLISGGACDEVTP